MYNLGTSEVWGFERSTGMYRRYTDYGKWHVAALRLALLMHDRTTARRTWQ